MWQADEIGTTFYSNNRIKKRHPVLIQNAVFLIETKDIYAGQADVCFFMIFHSIAIMTTVTIAESRSAIGPANRMPSIPRNMGSNSNGGKKKIICRVRERNAPFAALPMAVKNVVEIGCKKSIQVKNKKIRKN